MAIFLNIKLTSTGINISPDALVNVQVVISQTKAALGDGQRGPDNVVDTSLPYPRSCFAFFISECVTFPCPKTFEENYPELVWLPIHLNDFP